ncbi:unnamed protein product [Onchocerca ochengi]|uniref:SHSP domain-containing protein n=1 Tax=Onchocerca ochengi TaxID=42157 RepID=A0A182EF12_ONCOC|nr:unnamed protein product [Onchocerca ochengi]
MAFVFFSPDPSESTGSMSDEQKSNQFEVKLNVSNFHADDLQVNIHGRELIVSGHHNEREDGGGGIIERHFVRTYILPKNVKENELTSELNADGILKITIPIDETEYHRIPIKVDPNWKMQSNPCQELILRQPIPLWWW